MTQTNEPTSQKPLRLWPGIVAVVLQWMVLFVVPLVLPEGGMFGVVGAAAAGLAVVVWWVFFSRAAWSDRLGAIALMIAALFAASRLAHASIANGLMGLLLYFYAIPVLSLAFVLSVVASRRLSLGWRRASMAAAILCGWAIVCPGAVG